MADQTALNMISPFEFEATIDGKKHWSFSHH